MKRNLLAFALLLASVLPFSLQAESLFKIDFAEAENGPAAQWLMAQDWTFQAGASKQRMEIEQHTLVLRVKEDQLGQLVKRITLPGVTQARIQWGVRRYPKDANWEQGQERETILVAFAFGEELVESGTIFFPALPPVIGVFLGQKEQEGKQYLGRYYKHSIRYLCSPCGAPEDKEVTTLVNLKAEYQKAFGTAKPFPALTGLALSFDTRKVGRGEAFIRSIELLSDDAPAANPGASKTTTAKPTLVRPAALAAASAPPKK